MTSCLIVSVRPPAGRPKIARSKTMKDDVSLPVVGEKNCL
jgi:hypothetical protein